MKTKKTLIALFIFSLLLGNTFIHAQKEKQSPEHTLYGVRDDGFSFKISGKLKIGSSDLNEFNEIDYEGIEYPVLLNDIVAMFPINNLVQLETGFLLKTTLPWQDVNLVTKDEKYTIKTSQLLRLSFDRSIKSFEEFNNTFSDVILEKMEPIDRKDSLETYIYQFDGKDLIYIRKTTNPKELKESFDVETAYDIIKKIQLKEMSIYFPYERIMYLSNGYKIYLSYDFVNSFENQANERRIYIIASSSLKKKAEELFLANIKIKYDNLWKATRLYKTIGSAGEAKTISPVLETK